MPFRSTLYRLASAIELVTGVTLLSLPAIVMQQLFSSPASDAGEQLTRLYGLALIGLGVACWGSPCPISARRGLLVYNCSAAVLLIILGSQALSGGAAVWAGALIHVVLGVLMIRDQLVNSSG
ncbi:putative membrane protein [Synechococcus sp. BIOS-E4-1]|nr:putative membrane protein [Synechococcus sp. BIOS-E4-1]